MDDTHAHFLKMYYERGNLVSSSGVIGRVPLVAVGLGRQPIAIPARLLIDDTHAHTLTGCEGGNPVTTPGVGSNMPLVAVDLDRKPKSVKCSPHLDVAVLVMLGNISLKKKHSEFCPDLLKKQTIF